MSDAELPDSSELTKEDFARSGWRDAIGDSPMTRYTSAHHDLLNSSKKAQAEGDLARAKVLLLLAAACSMRLTNKSRSEPFEPMWVIDGHPSPTPDWFREPDIAFLAEILDDVDHPMLKGRLADLVWVKKVPAEVRFALEAIDSYHSLDLNTETWATEVGKCWKRALTLTMMMGAGVGDRSRNMRLDLMTKFDNANKEDGRFAHWLAEILGEFGPEENAEGNLAEKLEALAHEFKADGNFGLARAYYSLSGDWFRIAGKNQKQIDMKVAVAEGWAEEAERGMSSDTPSALLAVGHYDNAIQAYREIPRIEREARQIDQRITRLMQLHTEAGELSLSEMTTISTPGLDISETVEKARNAVHGREPIQTLKCFTSLHHTDAKRLREISQENLERYPLIALASQTTFSDDGRVAAKSPGTIPTDSSEEAEKAIWAQMIQNYDIHVGAVVQACIMPALEVMHIEHRFRESDFIELARNSPAVPPRREELFGKAIFHGYEYDFATALHLLTPQIEHMVRYRLKSAGVITTRTDSYGIEDEKGLSNLIEAPEFEQIFGEDLAFEVKALFCDHLGPNLRNNVAHGLLDSRQCYSAYSVYAWWLALKITFRAYWRAYQRHIGAEDSVGSPTETSGS